MKCVTNISQRDAMPALEDIAYIECNVIIIYKIEHFGINASNLYNRKIIHSSCIHNMYIYIYNIYLYLRNYVNVHIR